MPDTNVENLRTFLESWNLEEQARGEMDMWLYDPEITYEDTILPDHVGEIYRRHEGLARSTVRWLETLENPSFELEEIIGTGDHLVSIQRLRGKMRFTGIDIDASYAYHWAFRDGKVLHFKSFLDPAEALKDAGLEE